MPAPWEKYQQPASAPPPGPWAKYAGEQGGTAAGGGDPAERPTGKVLWETIGGQALMDMLGGASRDPERARKAAETFKGLVHGIAEEPARVWDQLSRSGEAMVRGDVSAAASHLGGAVPFIGATAREVQHDVEKGDYGAAVERTAGMVLPMLAPKVPAAVEAARGVPGRMASATAEVVSSPVARDVVGVVSPRAGRALDMMARGKKAFEAARAARVEPPPVEGRVLTPDEAASNTATAPRRNAPTAAPSGPPMEGTVDYIAPRPAPTVPAFDPNRPLGTGSTAGPIPPRASTEPAPRAPAFNAPLNPPQAAAAAPVPSPELQQLREGIAQGMNGAKYSRLDAAARATVDELADRIIAGRQAAPESAAPAPSPAPATASASAPPPVEEPAGPNLTAYDLLQQELAAKRAARPPEPVASSAIPVAKPSGVLNPGGVNAPLRPPMATAAQGRAAFEARRAAAQKPPATPPPASPEPAPAPPEKPVPATPASSLAEQLAQAMVESGTAAPEQVAGGPRKMSMKQAEAAMARKKPATESPQSPYTAEGERKSPQTRATEIANSNTEAKAQRWADALYRENISPEDWRNATPAERAVLRDGMIAKGTLAEGEALPNTSESGMLTELQRKWSGAAKAQPKAEAAPAPAAPVPPVKMPTSYNEYAAMSGDDFEALLKQGSPEKVFSHPESLVRQIEIQKVLGDAYLPRHLREAGSEILEMANQIDQEISYGRPAASVNALRDSLRAHVERNFPGLLEKAQVLEPAVPSASAPKRAPKKSAAAAAGEAAFKAKRAKKK